MTFLWPEMLLLLLIVPALVVAYFFILKRKKQAALKYASLIMVKEAMSAGQKFRRHIPPLLFIISLFAMILAIARPAAIVTLPSQHRTIILAMDISGSMRATDVQPNRLAASQAAAKAFVADQPSNVRIGVVAFAGTASVVQMPTNNREDIIAAIDRFQLQRATAIGSGIIVSLAAIFPDAGIDVSSFIYGREGARGVPLDQSRKTDKPAFKPVPPGSYGSAAIILLTDGQRTTGPRPRCSCLHRRNRHSKWRDTRLRRLVHAGAPRRGIPQSNRQHDPRRVFLCRHGNRPEESLPIS